MLSNYLIFVNRIDPCYDALACGFLDIISLRLLLDPEGGCPRERLILVSYNMDQKKPITIKVIG